MKPQLGIAGYLLGLIVVVAALAELGARVLFPAYADDDRYLELAFSRLLNSQVVFDLDEPNADRRFGYVLSPNAEMRFESTEFVYTARTNSLGFRTKELSPRTADEYRVLLLGDSMFWGVGVDYPETVASAIEAQSNGYLSVLNFSISGYNTVQELIVVRSYVDSVNPDQVILGVFIGNDILANAITYEDENGSYRLDENKRDALKRELRDQLGPFYALVMYRVAALPVYVPRIRYLLAARQEVLADTYSLIDEVATICRDRGIDFSVFILYPKDAVRGGLVEAWSRSRRPGNLIRQHLEQQGIRVLDLLDYMHGFEHANTHFFREDGHLNGSGNAVVAKAILDELVE